MTTQFSNEQISVRAYYLWEAEGRQQGRDQEYWLKAQADLAAKAQKPPEVKASQATRTAPVATAKKTASQPVIDAKAPKKKSNASRTPAYA